jgi:hypothetical protein
MPAENMKLIPCPFCGGSAKIFGGLGDNYYVACTNKVCFCSLGEQYYPGDIPAHIFGDEESAAFNWNRRADIKVKNFTAPNSRVKQGRKAAHAKRTS